MSIISVNESRLLSPTSSQSSSSAHSRVHLVGSDGVFKSSSSEISRWLQSLGMLEKSTQYFVVGIMGAQSSGKSTLLNLLFGTEFDELDASRGRQMTTKGVWLGSSPLVEGAIVMDLEGTDSVTRHAERHPFERQSALLGLSVAEVLIINMWQHDIGRYVASNYGVLATVFEVNLALLHDQLKDSRNITKTMLMFCIRDHVEHESPLAVISNQLTADTKRIWEELKKPEALKDLEVDDIFDLRFVALPHKRYESDKFISQVNDLRSRFLDSSRGDYLLGVPYHLQKSASVPTDGLGFYIETIWDTIRTHKDLNLPSQKEMLAIYRCDELLQDSGAVFQAAIAPLRKRVSAAFQDDFAPQFQKLLNTSLDSFTANASGYHEATVVRKKAELRERLLEDMRPLFGSQMRHARAQALQVFTQRMEAALPKDGTAVLDFSAVCSECRQAAEHELKHLYASSVVDSVRSVWMAAASLQQLQSALDTAELRFKQRQIETLVKEAAASLKKKLITPCKLAFECGETDMWQQVTSTFQQWFSDSRQQVLDKKLPGLGLNGKEEEEVRGSLATLAVSALQEEALKQAAFVRQSMLKRFDQLFRNDESGLPRKWQDEKNIRQIYLKARDEALTLLDLFAKFCVVVDESDADDTSSGLSYLQKLDKKSLLTVSKLRERKEAFVQDCEHALRGAETAQARAFELARTPVWVFPLLAILGFNEFMAVISSPFLMILAMFLAIAAGTIYYLNMTGPVILMLKLASRKASAALSAVLEAWADPGEPSVPSFSPSGAAVSDESSNAAVEPQGGVANEEQTMLRHRAGSHTSHELTE